MGILKLRRGSSIQRAFAGLVFGLFGILWMMIAIHVTADTSLPAVGIVLSGLGGLITIWYWGQAAYYLIHAANQQRFAEDDFAADEIVELIAPAVKRCQKCRAELAPTFRYCPQCGTKA